MISFETPLETLGAIICQALRDAGIDAFLSGGAVVSIYSENEFESFDLDFVSFGDRARIDAVMKGLGFSRKKSRLYQHPQSNYMVEFPGVALQIGDEPIKEFAERVIGGKTLKLLTPTDCVKDRLAAYIHWNDRQGLEQAAVVALKYPCNIRAIEKFCEKEGSTPAFSALMDRIGELKVLKPSER
jgi:hypothetical protein